MTLERVTVRVELLLGDQVEIVGHAPPAVSAKRERYPAAEIAFALGVPVDELPGAWLTAEVGEQGRLLGWQFA